MATLMDVVNNEVFLTGKASDVGWEALRQLGAIEDILDPSHMTAATAMCRSGKNTLRSLILARSSRSTLHKLSGLTDSSRAHGFQMTHRNGTGVYPQSPLQDMTGRSISKEERR